MAHVAKYKATSVGHMLAHYRRDQSSLERENIDRDRTESNFVLGFGTDGVVRVRDQSQDRVPNPNWLLCSGSGRTVWFGFATRVRTASRTRTGRRFRSDARRWTVPQRPMGEGLRARMRC